MDMPFTPFPYSTTRVSLGATTLDFTVPASAAGRQVIAWVDNRGVSDIMVELGGGTPSDTTSFAVAPMSAQALYLGDEKVVRLKRPDGSSGEDVLVAFGRGV